MNYKPVKTVCRNSRLAQLQVEEVFSLYPLIKYELTMLKSFGDKHKEISLMDNNVDADFFTRELDQAVLDAKADIAIHSAKDLPYPLPPGLEIYCLTSASYKTDALVDKHNRTLLQLPAGAKVGTSSKSRREELLKLRSDLVVVDIRGSVEERIDLIEKGDIDALIVATCALRRLGLNRLIAEVLPFKTHPLQGNLAIVGRTENEELKSRFAAHDIRRKYGRVTIVGFGPGNPDLLTVGGERAIARADILFHDDLIDRTFLDKYRATKVYVGKRSGKHNCQQDEINEQLYNAAISGRNSVRLKGGDPMIFAHGREEIDFLKSRHIDVTVIPGISSGIALAAYTHIPLTHRGIASSVAFASGHASGERNVPVADTLVYYMAGENMSNVAKQLIAAGRNADTPAAWICDVSLPAQKIGFSTLKELQFSVVKTASPVLVIVGEVVALESRMAQQPNILVTGTSCEEYRGQGNLTHTPLITVERNREANDLLKKAVGEYGWIVFTSRYGVRFFFEILDELRLDVHSFGAAKIASIGKTTSLELAEHNIRPDLEPEPESAEGLIRRFEEIKLSNARILLPRSNKGLPYLPEALEKMGNRVTDLPVYNNMVNKAAEKVDLSRFQKIVFSSPSGVEAFMKMYGRLPEGMLLAARGRTTEEMINK
ncbi:MAG: uroporphyrinogen-III C-methyltransferase [Dysgonamonadaceae bacterium]|jgi:uroporphyrinogen III methyltransferase/synthase|nr:uroporphyrinogen-III C-methyltransferase [Dysgonamonadaceae bacterium]